MIAGFLNHQQYGGEGEGILVANLKAQRPPYLSCHFLDTSWLSKISENHPTFMTLLNIPSDFEDSAVPNRSSFRIGNTPHHPHPWRPNQPSQTPTRHPKEKPKWHTADAARTKRLDLRPRTARPIFVAILSIFCFLSMKYDTTKNPEKHAETT